MLDLISDIGGMQGVLISVFAIIVGIQNHNMLENHLVSRLFKLEVKPDRQSLDSKLYSPEPSSMVSLMPRAAQNILELLREKFKGCMCMTNRCCKPSLFYQGFEIGREQLKDETNIIEIIKKLRYYETALNALTSEHQRAMFKAKSQYKNIRLDQTANRAATDV